MLFSKIIFKDKKTLIKYSQTHRIFTLTLIITLKKIIKNLDNLIQNIYNLKTILLLQFLKNYKILKVFLI